LAIASIRSITDLPEHERQTGSPLAIDDFGTRYSPLASLQPFPIDCWKSNRSFIQDIEHSDREHNLACSLVKLAHTLGRKAVVDGVEAAAQRSVREAMGCDELDGFLLSESSPP
jgi:EAL domain-containing protein (putative c-di-GMP-specific phosphodiesterase class I)